MTRPWRRLARSALQIQRVDSNVPYTTCELRIEKLRDVGRVPSCLPSCSVVLEPHHLGAARPRKRLASGQLARLSEEHRRRSSDTMIACQPAILHGWRRRGQRPRASNHETSPPSDPARKTAPHMRLFSFEHEFVSQPRRVHALSFAIPDNIRSHCFSGDNARTAASSVAVRFHDAGAARGETFHFT